MSLNFGPRLIPIFMSLAVSLLGLGAQAQSYLQVKTLKTVNVLAQPKTGAARIGAIAKGKTLQVQETSDRNFLKITSKGGREGYIPTADTDYGNDSWEASSPTPAPSKLTYDLGFSTGELGGRSYSEVNLGLNWFFKSWLAWRNALFHRFVEGEDISGLDSSARLFHFMRWSQGAGATLFGGPGYRFVSEGDHLPFGEAGVIIRLGGLSLGGGFKAFFPDLIGSKQGSDTQYFIILSGSGSVF